MWRVRCVVGAAVLFLVGGSVGLVALGDDNEGDGFSDEQLELAIEPLVVAATRNDYDGDGYSDVAVWRPSFGNWYVRTSSGTMPPGGGWNQIAAGEYWKQLGLPTYIPVPGDYGADGKPDLGVYRPSNQTWYLSCSEPGTYTIQFGSGQQGDVPKPATFAQDGMFSDNKCDLAYYVPSMNRWYIRDSNNPDNVVNFAGPSLKSGSTREAYLHVSKIGLYQRYYEGGQQKVRWSYTNPNGSSRYMDATAAHSDLAINYRPYPPAQGSASRWSADGRWITLKWGGGELFNVQWGLSGDIPLVGDYDGDGTDDRCVWRPSNGTFYVLTSGGNQPPGGGWYSWYGGWAKQWGLSGDVPVQCNP